MGQLPDNIHGQLYELLDLHIAAQYKPELEYDFGGLLFIAFVVQDIPAYLAITFANAPYNEPPTPRDLEYSLQLQEQDDCVFLKRDTLQAFQHDLAVLSEFLTVVQHIAAHAQEVGSQKLFDIIKPPMRTTPLFDKKNPSPDEIAGNDPV